MKIVFAAVFLLVFALMLMYSKKRFFEKISFSWQLKRVFLFALMIIYSLVILYFINRFYDFLPSWAYYISSLSLAIGFIIFVFALFYEFFVLADRLFKLQAKNKKIVEFIIFYSMILYLALGISSGFSDIKVKEYELSNPKISQEMKIVFLSDLHIGPLVDVEYVKKTVDAVNSQNPDLIVIGGDLIDANLNTIEAEINELKKLKSKYGIFYVIGNHEYFYNEEDVIRKFQDIGFKVFENSYAIFDEHNISISGIYDFMGYRKDSLKPDLKGLGENQKFYNILVSHQPKIVKHPDFNTNNFDLVLSGHTHCGQIAPFGLLVLIDQPFLCGHHKLSQSSSLIISSGAGFWGPKMRIGSEFEIVSIKLLPNSR